MSKVITDENQLNTEVDDLITEDYALEVLGLKNPADFRKFSRSFMKLSKIVKGIENVSNKVANKTELGRVKIGDNLTITEDGVLSGNPEYIHPVEAGYKHIPAGGTVGQVLKNNGNGSAEWGNLSLENYYTKPEIDTKFKNYCPISIGSIDVRYDNKNPAELYPSTTWELLSSDKYIRTGNTPLQTGGNNSVSILKENLPNTKLQVENFNLTRGTMDITGTVPLVFGRGEVTPTGAFAESETLGRGLMGVEARDGLYPDFKASRSWTGATSNASPYTESLGSGTALSIQPSYITLKFWKRLS